MRGTVNWRQRDLPVVDFERLRGQPEQQGGVRQRIVVCYASDAGPGVPLLGLIAQGIPRLLRVSPIVIEDAAKPLDDASPLVMTLRIEDESFTGPDIDYMVRRCARVIGAEA